MESLLTSAEVAEWLKVSQSSLSRWRSAGRGPRAVYLSPASPRYRRVDVQAWLDRMAV